MAVKSRVTFLELVKAVRLSNSQYFEVEVQARFFKLEFGQYLAADVL